MDEKAWKLLETWLTRLEKELSQNSKDTTEIRAKVFNGMSSKIDTTYKTVQKLYDEFDAHVREEQANLTIKIKGEIDSHHKEHHRDDHKTAIKKAFDEHEEEYHDSETQAVIKKAKEASVVALWTTKYIWPLLSVLGIAIFSLAVKLGWLSFLGL